MLKEKLCTPCYIIDQQKFQENCKAVMDSFRQCWGENMAFGYSIKTNHNGAMMTMAKNMGWLAEAVSADEYHLAQSLGFAPDQMIFNGPLKGELLTAAVKQGTMVNLDHLEEIAYLCSAFTEEERKSIRIGIRINFDLERLCPGETSVGNDVGRFGICYENGDVAKAVATLQDAGIVIAGLHMHTSTKSRSAGVFAELAKMVCKVTQEFQLDLDYVDMGGGYFGGQVVEGKPTMTEYAETICSILKEQFVPQHTKLILEPGASVIATSVEYRTKVDSVRDIRGVKVITLDGTALHINPFLFHRTPQYVLPERNTECVKEQQICGCTCMENDRFFTLYNEELLQAGDDIVFKNAGAYTMGFNSHFIVNPPAVYVLDTEQNLTESDL